MAHYAKIEKGIVQTVIVADADNIAGADGTWIQVSYNTRGGIHYGPDGQPDGGVALRKNYPGIGWCYDSVLDCFYPPRPFPSWTLDTDTAMWNPPIPRPTELPPQPSGSQRIIDWRWFEPELTWVPADQIFSKISEFRTSKLTIPTTQL